MVVATAYKGGRGVIDSDGAIEGGGREAPHNTWVHTGPVRAGGGPGAQVLGGGPLKN